MDLFGGTGGIIIMLSLVAITIIKILYQVWLIKYVRPLDKKEFEKVLEISRPSKDDSFFQLIKDILRQRLN
jgi:archaellum biogenesis protein FlaJ (TadC family)